MEDTKASFATRVKDFFSKTGKRVKFVKFTKPEGFKPELNDSGMLSETVEEKKERPEHNRTAMVKTGPESSRNDL